MSRTSPRRRPGRRSAVPRNPREVRLSEHPRARRQIRQAKAWAGVAGVLLAGYASYSAGAPDLEVAVRALVWGVVAYVVVWACAVQVWRHLAVAEVRAAERRRHERRAELERRLQGVDVETTTVVGPDRP